jgi:transcription-repair coupling factor (superfamily II helicase)
MNIARSKAVSPAKLLEAGRPLTIAHVVDGAEGMVLADLARTIAAQPNAPATSLAVVCRDGTRMAQLSRALAFFASDVGILECPAWDCQP